MNPAEAHADAQAYAQARSRTSPRPVVPPGPRPRPRPYYSDEHAELFAGDCREVLGAMPEGWASCVVADPPYGLSDRPPDVRKLLEAWLAGADYDQVRAGFMGRSWDACVPGPATWEEVLRVMKPGATLLCFAGAKNQDLMGLALRLTGFEVLDTIQWISADGFAKGVDVPKALTRMQGQKRRAHGMVPLPEAGGPETARRHRGLHTALRPAHETIIRARKPLSERNVALNVLTHGTGALDTGAGRIEGDPGDGVWGSSNATVGPSRMFNASPDGASYRSERHPDGRYPKNVIFSCCGEAPARGPTGLTDGRGENGRPRRPPCPDCPVAELDRQGGRRKSGANPTRRRARKFPNVYGEFEGQTECVPRRGPDEGHASRFFFVARASATDRALGLEDLEETPILWSNGTSNPGSFQSPGTRRSSKNPHVCVKPSALIKYLLRMVARPGQTVLDPFAGSGTTGLAATLLGRRSVLIEREPTYLPIAARRLAWAARRGPEAVQDPLFTPGETHLGGER